MATYTQKMTMHLNGGNTFSELHYSILADGVETGITRHTRTYGSPHYLKIADELHAGEDTFDVLANRAVGMIAWIESHLDRAGAREGE